MRSFTFYVKISLPVFVRNYLFSSITTKLHAYGVSVVFPYQGKLRKLGLVTLKERKQRRHIVAINKIQEGIEMIERYSDKGHM